MGECRVLVEPLRAALCNLSRLIADQLRIMTDPYAEPRDRPRNTPQEWCLVDARSRKLLYRFMRGPSGYDTDSYMDRNKHWFWTTGLHFCTGITVLEAINGWNLCSATGLLCLCSAYNPKSQSRCRYKLIRGVIQIYRNGNSVFCNMSSLHECIPSMRNGYNFQIGRTTVICGFWVWILDPNST